MKLIDTYLSLQYYLDNSWAMCHPDNGVVGYPNFLPNTLMQPFCEFRPVKIIFSWHRWKNSRTKEKKKKSHHQKSVAVILGKWEQKKMSEIFARYDTKMWEKNRIEIPLSCEPILSVCVCVSERTKDTNLQYHITECRKKSQSRARMQRLQFLSAVYARNYFCWSPVATGGLPQQHCWHLKLASVQFTQFNRNTHTKFDWNSFNNFCQRS